MANFLDLPTRYLFFTGKGGVGKTSLACATAIRLADQGKKVLLVSTDPASNLDQVLEIRLSGKPTSVPGVSGLEALNIDPEAAAQAYRERSVGPFRGILPEDSIRQMEEQLSGACTVEVAAFDEFTGLLTDDAIAGGYDHVIFDTAPTGHTLRLLRLPAAWTHFIDVNTRGASCLGPASALKSQRERYGAAVEALGNREKSTVILVTRPEKSSVSEAERTSQELKELGLSNQNLVINGIFTATDRQDETALALEKRARDVMLAPPGSLREKPVVEIALQGHDMVGLAALRALFSPSISSVPQGPGADASGQIDFNNHRFSQMIDEIASADQGLILVMGKGGVGKTTLAAAIAVELASRGKPAHLSTTDPAAHVASVVEEEIPNLRVSRIDPKAETESYVNHVLSTSGKDLDTDGRALLEEDLRSPCTEEVAVFKAFSKVVNEARRGFVVLDTAPTGHTLLLLDATGAYHRDVVRNMSGAGNVTTPMMRLSDPVYTKVLVATLAETTPMLEAEELQDDLRRAGIEPFGWVINQSLAATGTSDPVLLKRAASERKQMARVKEGLVKRLAVVPWYKEVPRGRDRLLKLAGGKP